MSLLTEQMEACVILNKQTVDDGYGGYVSRYVPGAEFQAAIVFDTSIEARAAEKQGVTSRYSVLFPKTLKLEYHDVFRRMKDGKIFRATEDGDDYQAPNSASPIIRGLAHVAAEEWSLPNG